jgi:hypothetical protein
MVSSSRRN